MSLQNKKMVKLVHLIKVHLEHPVVPVINEMDGGRDGVGGERQPKFMRSRVYPNGHLPMIKISLNVGLLIPKAISEHHLTKFKRTSKNSRKRRFLLPQMI